MDDIVVKSRYPRHNIPARRRVRCGRTKSNLPRLMARQFAVCLAIFLVIFAIKSINTPFTNYITGKVQYMLGQNIELGNIFKTVDNAIGKLRSGSINNNEAVKKTSTSDIVEPESSVLSASTEDGAAFAEGMALPVNGVLSSPFGKRKDPVTKVLKMHEGIDIDAGNGENILAALDGTVIAAGSSPSYGKYLRIRHWNGLETVYAHCSEINVMQGQKAAKGDVIAKVGNTGVSIGTHLHFEVWKDGKAVDPLEYIKIPLP